MVDFNEIVVQKKRRRDFKDLVGKRFGNLVVLELVDVPNKTFVKWRVKCDCGNEKVVQGHGLKSGGLDSCGCLFRKRASQRMLARSRNLNKNITYSVWKSIKTRCFNQNFHAYKEYGGRGITICKKWANSFDSFVADVGERPSLAHSIDRFPNNDGNYEPGNVRWATRAQQARNKRTNRIITWNDESMCLSDWAERFGISLMTLSCRIKARGVGQAMAMSQPIAMT